MDSRSKVSGGRKPLTKAIRVAIWQSGHQIISNISACKAQANQHEIRIAFFGHDNFLKNPQRNARALIGETVFIISR